MEQLKPLCLLVPPSKGRLRYLGDAQLSRD